MSRTLETAFEAAKETEFIIDKPARKVEVRNAFIFWTNFAGEANQYGNKARTFNLAVPEEAVPVLEEMNFHLRHEPVYVTEDGNGNAQDTLYVHFINVKVNMESAYPPNICLFTEHKGKKSRRVLTVENIGILDRTALQTCDCKFNAYTSKRFPDKCTGYLTELYAIQEPETYYGGKYDDWMDEDPNEVLEDAINRPYNSDNY